jgi:hypothetical protein
MKIIIACLAAISLAACSTSPTREQLAKDQERSDEIRAKAAAQEEQRRQTQAEAQLSAVPAWALESPKPDATGVYAVGFAQSGDYRMALRKATLDAEFGLAKVMGQEISGSERSFAQDVGTRTRAEQYTAMVDKLVAQVPVVGFENVHQEIKPIAGDFHAFVLLRLPYESLNKVIEQKRAQSRDASINAQFDDLARRVKARQEQLRQQGMSVAVGPDNGVKPAAMQP